MKQNTKFLAITLILAVVVSAPLIGNIREEISKDNNGSEDSTPAASVMVNEVLSVTDSKYGDYTYTKYTNPRFGFKIEYPSFLSDKRESENGDGIILQNPEQNVVLIVSGINNILNQTPEALFNGYVNNTKDIVYKKLVGNTFMIAAENGETVYYIFENVGAGSINTFVVGYPKKDAKAFEKIIKHLKKTFESPYVHESR